MTRFCDYATTYQTIRMERRDGILNPYPWSAPLEEVRLKKK